MKKLPSDPLTPAEWSVMKVVWELGECTSRDIYTALHEQHGWANTTVKTLLGKLVQKDLLSIKQDGKRYIYTAKQSSIKMMTKAADAFMEKSMDGQIGQLLCYMVNKVELSQSDIEELETILTQYKNRKV
jgi:BlaI family penicillinase repressor